MDTQLPDLDASGDFIRNLRFTPTGTSKQPPRGSGDTLEVFFHTLKGSEGTLRAWKTRPQPDKLAFIAAIERPDPKRMSKAEVDDAEKFWRNTLLGVLFMELSQPGGDPLVAQAALDSLRPEKVGKR